VVLLVEGIGNLFTMLRGRSGRGGRRSVVAPDLARLAAASGTSAP
jgi:hypothetical protein